MRCSKVIAPMRYSRTMDWELFEAWLQQFLCPSLELGKIFVMENAAFHREKPLEHIAYKFGHRIIFLPLYSPGLTPIERYRAALKKRLRRIMEHMDSIDNAIAF